MLLQAAQISQPDKRKSSLLCEHIKIYLVQKLQHMQCMVGTFSPMASCKRMVSPDILPITSPVFVSSSKKAISCLRIVFRYSSLIRAVCLSPVTAQHASSEKFYVSLNLSFVFLHVLS